MAVSESASAAAYSGITYRIIGCAMKVHNTLGPGLKESIYQRALSTEMREAGLSFVEEFPFQVTLGGEQVGLLYLDHFVENTVVVEEKAFSHMLTDEEVAQVITYLAVAKAPVGLLLNFGRNRLEYKRILPPKKFEDWHARAARYLWKPPGALPNPLIRSTSADSSAPPNSTVRNEALIRSISAVDSEVR
jgi:GxxExxY protein